MLEQQNLQDIGMDVHVRERDIYHLKRHPLEDAFNVKLKIKSGAYQKTLSFEKEGDFTAKNTGLRTNKRFTKDGKESGKQKKGGNGLAGITGKKEKMIQNGL
jgi:hypothetical protein